MISEKSEVPEAASLRPELDFSPPPHPQFLAAAGKAAPAALAGEPEAAADL